MCRSIKTLHNYDPPTDNKDIEAASLQFIRKISGYRTPSKINEEAFNQAVVEVGSAVEKLLGLLKTSATPKKRIN